LIIFVSPPNLSVSGDQLKRGIVPPAADPLLKSRAPGLPGHQLCCNRLVDNGALAGMAVNPVDAGLVREMPSKCRADRGIHAFGAAGGMTATFGCLTLERRFA
jgi:hypothetical protein